MGIIDWYKDTRERLDKGIRLFNAGEVTPTSNLAILPRWYFEAQLGQPRHTDIAELRQYAKSCWVQMVVNAIVKQVKTTDWDVILEDEEDNELAKKYEKELIKAKEFLECPNRNGDTFGEIWGAFLKDVLEIDAGVILKGKSKSGELLELFAHDGSRFLFDMDRHGIINGFYQYSFLHPSAAPIPFDKDKIIYGRMNMSSEHYPYGFAPLQAIQQEVEVLIQSTRYNKEFFKNNAIPDGIVNAEMNNNQLNRLQSQWNTNLKGKAHKLAFMNAKNVSFTPFKITNKDMEWLEGQKWYFHQVFAAYGLSPAEVGFYEDVNRSAQEGQERTTIRNAVEPYLKLIEDKINREVLPELIGNDAPIKFQWFSKDSQLEDAEHRQMMDKLTAGILTINEVRSQQGLEPVEWGDKPMPIYQQERYAEMGGNEDDEEYEDDDEEEDTEDKKSFDEWFFKSNAKFIKNEDADNYVDFLRDRMDVWEKQILSAVDTYLKDEVVEKKGVDYSQKAFGEFLSKIFNAINTSGFHKLLRLVIKKEMIEGTKEAESELSVDVGVGINFQEQLDVLKDRQLEGFHINGKKWNGLKGVARNLQIKIAESVRTGLAEKKGLVSVKNDIKDIMAREKGGEVKGEVTEGRAMRIARTETNRFRNSGRLQAYKDSGLSGKKQWLPAPGENHHEFCDPKSHRLAFQKVGLDEPFIDPTTGKEFMHPPAHPNCRSIMQFVFDKD